MQIKNDVQEIKASNPLFVGSIAKGMRVLESFNEGKLLLGITDIVKLTGFEKNLVQRITNTFYEIGYLGKDTVQRKYFLTPKILHSCYGYLRSRRLFALALPFLIELRDRLNKSVNLCVLNDMHLTYVLRLWTKYYHEYSLIGECIPAYCSAGGRILLSRLSEEEQEDIINKSECVLFTRHTVTEKNELKKIVCSLKNKDFCWQVNQFIENEISVAALIHDIDGTVATIIVSGLLKKVTDETCQEFIDEVLPDLMQTVHTINRYCGV